MPKFPKQESEVLLLAYMMLGGFSLSPLDFPSVDSTPLSNALNDYITKSAYYKVARSAAQQATEAKNTKLDELLRLMKNCLKKSQVDTAAAPQKLSLIGWGPKPAAQASEIPDAPMNLVCIEQGGSKPLLRWQRPSGKAPVRNYIIERRMENAEGTFGAFVIAASSFSTEITLADQPLQVQLEYRVKAVNTAGESMPSNVVAVVL
jgi:hypothetical protein